MLRNLSSRVPCTTPAARAAFFASKGNFRVIPAVNEPIKTWLAGSPEREAVQAEIKRMRSEVLDIPLIIGGKEIRTGKTIDVVSPHDHKHVLGKAHQAGPEEVQQAIAASLEAQAQWRKLPTQDRQAIFLKMAELISSGPYRTILNAATIVGQSKNMFQAEIDASCELLDFLRFNVEFSEEIYDTQPISPSPNVWNRSEYRPLEGFVYAVTPFNFTAIAGNLTLAPAMMGNVCLWKPSQYALLSGYYLMQLFKDAGVPDGVINFVPGDPEMVTDIALAHPMFAGLHYTGSSAVFRSLWGKIGAQMPRYRSYPRIVGETGGKDFIFAHASADAELVATAMIMGAFEYAGQKCSAASRAYIPASLWPNVKQHLEAQHKEIKMGNPEEHDTLVNAVSSRVAFDRNASYLDLAKSSKDCTVLLGGNADDSVGYFIEPTVIQTTDREHRLMTEEIFGPILTVYVYPDAEYDDTVKHCASHTQYALTGSFFARDRYAIAEAERAFEDAAGNFYINDKPTGAVVGQQPFGGARGSGTNDKAGAGMNLMRWVQARSIKETFLPPRHFKYPYMKE